MKNIIKIAFSHINSKNKNFITKIHSLLAIIGITLGVTALIVVSSVMNGYSEDLYEHYAQGYDIEVLGNEQKVNQLYEELKKDNKIKNIWYVDKVQFKDANIKFKNTVLNIYATEKYGKSLGLQDIVVNEYFLVFGKVYIPLMLIDKNGNLIEQDIFKIKKTRKGTGLNIYMSKETLENSFFSPYKLKHGFHLNWKELKDRNEIFEKIKSFDKNNELTIRSWVKNKQKFLNSIELEQFIIQLVLFFILTVSCFNIISTLTLIIKDKKQDIYILKTLGYSNTKTICIFVISGLILGLFGLLLGTIFGILITQNLLPITQILEETFGIVTLPKTLLEIPYLLNQDEIIKTNIFTGIVILISSVIPAMSTLKLTPAQGLKDE